MSFGVTPTGFIKKTYADIKSSLEQKLISYYPTISLDPRRPAGQLVALMSFGLTDAWDRMAEIYGSMNPAFASSASLDNNFSILNLVRIDASATKVNRVTHWSTATSGVIVVPQGSKARQSATGQDYTLLADVTLTFTAPQICEIQVTNITAGATCAFTVNGIAYSRVNVSGDTLSSIVAGLIALVNPTLLKAYASSTGLIRVEGLNDEALTISALTNTARTQFGAFGDYECDITGTVSCPQNALDFIVTPIANWSSVENTLPGTLGREPETDTEYRTRASTFFLYGFGTEEGIRQYILNTVVGVLGCRVRSNRTGLPMGTLPPNSIEVVVDGGEDADIAQALWDAGTMGIQLYGLTTENVIDSEGNTQVVGFTRPTTTPIYVLVRLQGLNNEEPFPNDGVDLIKRNILNWAASRYATGRNVYTRDFLTPINQVSGLGDVLIWISDVDNGTFDTAPILIPYSSRATIDLANITVEVVT